MCLYIILKLFRLNDINKYIMKMHSSKELGISTFMLASSVAEGYATQAVL